MDDTNEELNLTIRPLRNHTEARFCAEFIAASDPWLKLGITFEQALQDLTDTAREVFVAETNEQTVGVMVLHRSVPLNGYIQILAVHPEWRSRGIGAAMLRNAEERILQQSPNVFLCVSSFNQRARQFYERQGYERVGELPDFLVKGFAEILMRKTRGPLLDFKTSSA